MEELPAVQRSRPEMKDFYRFNLSVDIPSPHRDSVKKVIYYMDHPSFRRTELVGDGGRPDFRASYMGYGALSRVRIHIQMADGSEYETEFNQRRALRAR